MTTTSSPMTALDAARHNLAHGIAQGWSPERIALLEANVLQEFIAQEGDGSERDDWRDDSRYDDEDRVPGDGDLFGMDR